MYNVRVMKKESFKKIAKIIGATIVASRPYSSTYEGGYLLSSDGQYFATDGRRIVCVNGLVVSPDKDVIVDYEGDEWDAENYKEKFSNLFSMNGKEVIYEWKVDLGKLIVENDWMKAKADTNNKVTFTTTFNHYRKGDTSRLVNVENVVLNHFNTRFIADILRIYRELHKNRTKSMVVTMKFTRSINEISSPCFIESEDGSFKYVVMPLFSTKPLCSSKDPLYYCEVDVIEAPKQNIF